MTIDAARPADQDAFLSLVGLATPGTPVPESITGAIHLPLCPPLTHGTALALVARTPHSPHPVGALIGGIPQWVFAHPLCVERKVLPKLLSSLVFTISAVAVTPGARGQGIGRKLIRSAERRAREANFALVTLEHEPVLGDFYTRLGYHTGDRQLVIALTSCDLLGQEFDGLHTAYKGLTPNIRVVEVPGAPARIVSGMLPGSTLPASARLDGRRVVT
ncbi:GNAT family N-acetyltransferase [Streptomyces sp. NPDC020883]|uniref:GNAT family N-acetyltransferase n=1 Tax=Streptomyces sp. NPDC020883 TaxID=3365099 RepID=UPI00378837A3